MTHERRPRRGTRGGASSLAGDTISVAARLRHALRDRLDDLPRHGIAPFTVTPLRPAAPGSIEDRRCDACRRYVPIGLTGAVIRHRRHGLAFVVGLCNDCLVTLHTDTAGAHR